MTLNQRFLDRLRHDIVTEYWTKLRAAAEALPAEQLWWRPNETSNSVGNLILHLSGNIRQWIVSGVHGEPDIRQRAAEFAARDGAPAGTLLAEMEATIAAVDRILGGLSPDELMAPRTIQGRDVTVADAIIQVAGHFALHLGQVILLAKLHAPGSIQFYEDAGGLARPLWTEKIRALK